MRKGFLWTLFFIVICSTNVFANDFLENNLLIQLYTRHDSCIREVNQGKYYLNPEKVRVIENKLCLDSDFFGPLILSCIIQDSNGMYAGLYYYYTCDDCGASYQSPPAECSVCGGTSFTRHDQSPGAD